jgi:hypothetical protein
MSVDDNAVDAHLAHGDTLGACAALVDVCPDDLNPGTQLAGTTCVVAEPVDACPDDLNPGVQEEGTECTVAEPDPVDACDDDLNPGVQEAGTECIVASDDDDEDANDEDMVDVCHVTGNGGVNLLSVAASAVAAHIGHGDYMPIEGSCDIDEPVFDACPDDLNPGNQEQGTQCVVAGDDDDDQGDGEGQDGKVEVCHVVGNGDVNLLSIAASALAAHLEHGDYLPIQASCVIPAPAVDACPDDLNPGTQETGTTCITAGGGVDPGNGNADPGSGDGTPAASGGDGDGAAAGNGGEAAEGQGDGDGDGGGAAAGAGEEPGAAAAAGESQDAAAAAGDDDLPFTGMSLATTVLFALLMLLAGTFAHAEASRASRRRRARA